MKVLVAIGGNALTDSNNQQGQIDQSKVNAVARTLIELEQEHTLVITHGNGPQVGWLAMQEVEANMSMDLLDAQSEGLLGYRLAQAMDNCRQAERTVTLLTRVEVDPADPAFSNPTKPIGPVLEEERAGRLGRQQGWQFTAVAGGRRRVVAAPQPIRAVEARAIASLSKQGYSVICAGGGGIPVVKEHDRYRGISAVIDKDHTSALLAAELELDALLLLTNVEALYYDWGKPSARAIRRVGCQSLKSAGLQQGSMAPKVEAACRFVGSTGGFAGIGPLTEAHAILQGEQGTRIVAGNLAAEWW
ncbi:amino acid kinase family protein [Thiohalophilus thiocyanatoxydans]|uniref:Carbamate kinase n=1 Tax=Thiohalophilus thiocyanatoxydans TaxID=381308 RepID=A0A4R8IN24_9GAMM|nr:carbamate kinase [Thiohalophilus thiocyanatoxydans]TDY00510.1 carbamate kinase [Thiohalophilus thiocyanatoxydans]